MDPAVVSFAAKTAQYLRTSGELCDRFVRYYAQKQEYADSFPADRGLLVTAIRFLAGVGPREREARKQLDAIDAGLTDAVTQNGIERKVLNGERDYLYKMLATKYGMEFEGP